MKKIFSWKRFWCPPEGSLQLDNSGYLTDPEGEYEKYSNPDVVSFERIKNTPCLILLGEPGIGKSQTIKDEVENIRKGLSKKDELILHVDLKEYGSEDSVKEAIFESEIWGRFSSGRYKLHLFLDSLDEVRIRIQNVQSVILKGLKKSPIDRLFFRIACRTAEWLWSFKDGLIELWKEKEQVKVYELAPLRLLDVQKAANSIGIDADKFNKAIDEKRAGPLASKPILLNFLINLFKSEGGFPASQAELYKKGCLHLCEESDPERREKGDINKQYVGYLTSEQRLTIASRIAASLLFSKNFAVYTDIDYGNIPSDCVTIKELIGGKEKTASSYFDIAEDSVKETLKTGLFTSRGTHLLGFAHQTYQEFLTAFYLKDAPLQQIKSLISHTHDEKRVIPQLHETAAWLAGQRTDVFGWLSSIESDILLRSDITKIGNDMKKNLVSSLLKRFKDEDLLDDRDFRDYYKKLAHPELFKQLEPIITDKSISIPRRVAIDIATACNVKELQKLLVEIALNQSENYHIRIHAAGAICLIGDDDTKKRLEPLAKGEGGDDPDDELKGYGMKCMWPKHWTTIELLKNITIPRENFLGAYFRFLQWEIVPHLPTPDLTTNIVDALNIINGWHYEGKEYDPLTIISDEIFYTAWSKIPDNSIMKSLSQLILSRINNHKPICDRKVWEALSSEEDKRHALIKFLIETLSIDEKNCRMFTNRETPLIFDNDFLWLLKQIESSTPEKQKLWAECIVNTLREDYSSEWINAFLEVHSRLPILQKKYPTFWELDSEISRNSKEMYLERLRWGKEDKQRSPEPSISEKIETSLKKIEEGNIKEWINLAYYLSVNQETGELHEWPSDIRDTHGWKTSDEQTQRRIVEAARNFILNHSLEGDECFGKGSYSWEVNAIYLAVRLIAEDKEIVNSIPDNIWNKLVPHMVDCPAIDDRKSRCALFELAYQKAPEAAKSYLLRLIDSENERIGNIFFIDHLKDCWNNDLTSSILNKINSVNLKPGSFRNIVEFLIDIGGTEIEDIVVKQITQNNLQSAILIESVSLLLIYWGEKQWSLIWNLFQNQPELAEAVLGNIAGSVMNEARFMNNLSESHLGDIYSFMNERFPPAKDPNIEGEHKVEKREMLANLRNAVLTELANKGTKEACAVIESLIEKLPEQRFNLIWRLKEAQANTLRKTWVPLTPSKIITLLQERNRRYVENEEQLLSVIIESLNRMQEYYKSSPAAESLWNYEGGGNNRRNFRPKDEESLSDGVERWIRDDLSISRGVIVNREVQLQRGQKTDIKINAVKLGDMSGDAKILTVVIEVKGCWNNEILTAMETQLYEKYMKENKIFCGLYLIGWYMCDKWDNSDSRKGKTPKMTLEELKRNLENQATNQLKEELGDIGIIKSFVLDLSL